MATEGLQLAAQRERAPQLSILDNFRNLVPATHQSVMEHYRTSALTHVVETDRLVLPEGVLVAYLLAVWVITRLEVGTLTIAVSESDGLGNSFTTSSRRRW